MIRTGLKVMNMTRDKHVIQYGGDRFEVKIRGKIGKNCLVIFV